MNNITLFTYTHSNCKDLWPIYFDLLDKHAHTFKSLVVSDITTDEYTKHKFVSYKDKNYCEEIADIVENKINSEYLIYMQEDFFLYDDVNIEELNYVKSFLDETSVSYTRLIKCGDVTNYKIKDKIYWVQTPDQHHNSVTSVSFQPTLWKTKDFVQVYRNTSYTKFQEGLEFAMAMNKLNYYATYYFNNEPKRGMMHWDSSIFPYIATAIVKGKWNMGEYEKELKPILDEWNIDVSVRGVC
jgi:hypothetical protein